MNHFQKKEMYRTAKELLSKENRKKLDKYKDDERLLRIISTCGARTEGMADAIIDFLESDPEILKIIDRAIELSTLKQEHLRNLKYGIIIREAKRRMK